MGRPWDAFFVFPYPNQRGPLWVNFRSPLVWDVVAISTYFTISLVFWYLGMIPDLATLRDRARGAVKKLIFRLLSLGWNGSHRTWSRYEIVSLILAGLATPLVVSVHTIVSMDFLMRNVKTDKRPDTRAAAKADTTEAKSDATTGSAK